MMITAPYARLTAELHQRLLLVGTATVLMAGCVTLTPMQKDRLAEVQAFADATSAHYKMFRVGVVVEVDNNLGIGAYYRLAHLYLNVRMLDSPNLTAIVAHELAHYVLVHDLPPGGASTAEVLRAQEGRELEANAKAVEILMNVHRMTEREAVQTMVKYLTAAQHAQDRGGARASGHRAMTAEIADLLELFPNSR
jgi:Zn-dependent peptidase ImmA (M78 family)